MGEGAGRRKKHLVMITSGKKRGEKRPPLDKFMEFSMKNRKAVTKYINDNKTTATAAGAAPSAASAAAPALKRNPPKGDGSEANPYQKVGNATAYNRARKHATTGNPKWYLKDGVSTQYTAK